MADDTEKTMEDDSLSSHKLYYMIYVLSSFTNNSTKTLAPFCGITRYKVLHRT